MIELLPGPSYIAANGDAVITVGSHNGDAYRGTLIDRLQHIGARQGIGRIKALALHHHAARHGDAMRHERLLGELLVNGDHRSEEHTSELQSLMRISYAVFCLKQKQTKEHDK